MKYYNGMGAEVTAQIEAMETALIATRTENVQLKAVTNVQLMAENQSLREQLRNDGTQISQLTEANRTLEKDLAVALSELSDAKKECVRLIASSEQQKRRTAVQRRKMEPDGRVIQIR